MNIIKAKLSQNTQQIVLRLITVSYRRILRPFSRLFRRFFEFRRIKRAYGIAMVAVTLSSIILPNYLVILKDGFVDHVQAQTTISSTILTEKSLRLPLVEYTITQKYGIFHQGIDMATSVGSPIYPVMDGIVIKVVRERVGYGNHVVVDHGGGLQSWYAHMSTIGVIENETVNRNSAIGTVGSTGHSTGPHLHLQIWQNGGWVNPEKFLEDYLDSQIENQGKPVAPKLAKN